MYILLMQILGSFNHITRNKSALIFLYNQKPSQQ